MQAICLYLKFAFFSLKESILLFVFISFLCLSVWLLISLIHTLKNTAWQCVEGSLKSLRNSGTTSLQSVNTIGLPKSFTLERNSGVKSVLKLLTNNIKRCFLFQCKIFWWHFYDHMNALYIKFCCSDGQNVYKTKKWILQKRNKKALILFILIASNNVRSHSKLFFLNCFMSISL